jgi:hypothetical protein
MKSWEELTEFLKDDKNKIAFVDVIKNLGFYTKEDVENETTGLKNNNVRILDEKKKLQKEFEEVKAKLEEIDLDEIAELKKGKQTKGKESEEVENLKKQLKTIETKLKQKDESETALKKENENIFTSVRMNEAIDEKYDPSFKKLLISAYQQKAKINEVDGKKDVYIDDENLGFLSAKEFFNKFITTDEGKKFAYIPKNAGANSNQFNKTAGGGIRKMAQAEFEALPTTEKIAFAKECKAGNAELII